MIRINLLGQAKPKASRRPVDTGAALPALFIGAGVLFGALILGYVYYNWQHQLSEENAKIKQLQTQKTDLEQVKLQVEAFEKQKGVLQQRVGTIEQLQRDRTGAQELLDQIASTVSRTENLWLTSMVKKDNNLTVGPHGQIKASVEAKGVIVQGKLEGNIKASERVELRKSATVTGDISTQRIAIEEGAYLKGKVDIQGKADKAAGK